MKNSVRLTLWALACLIFGSASVNAQNITTVIGGGPVGSNAITSSIGNPAAIRFDSAQNIYALDNNFGRVIKWDHTTGLISVYAGNGTAGFSGNNGPATSAQLLGPTGMCIDNHDNLFIADSDNNVIRVVIGPTAVKPPVLTGIATVVAGNIYAVAGAQTSTDPVYGGDGGVATLANLHFPDSCALDSASNLYIADRANNEIRVVVATSGVAPIGVSNTPPVVAGNIYKFAGGTDANIPAQKPPTGGYAPDNTAANVAQIYGPFDVAVDAANNVFFSDIGNNFDGNNTPDLDHTIPLNNNVVREILASDGTIHTVAGVVNTYGNAPTGVATAVAVNQPKGLTLDGSGNLFFADAGNNQIRKVVLGGNISVYAGNGSGGFNGDRGPATAATLTNPAGTAFNASGDLFIADQGNNVIREVSTAGGNGQTAGDIYTIVGNAHVSFGGDNGPALSAELNLPTGLAVDTSSNLFVADSGSEIIRALVNATAKMATVAGQTEAGGFTNDTIAPNDFGFLNAANSVAPDPAGNIFIADTGSCIIRKRTPTGIATFAGVDPTINNVNNPVTTNITTHCGFDIAGAAAIGNHIGAVQSVAVDSKGNVFFSDSTNSVVWEVPATTVGSLVAGHAYVVAGNGTAGFSGDGNAANQAELKTPMGIYVDIYDNLFIADAGNHRIREVPAANAGAMNAGAIYTIAGTGGAGVSGDNGSALAATLQYPFAIVVDHDDNVFFTDTTFNLFPTGGHTFSSQTVREIAGKTAGAKTAGNIYRVAGSATNAAGFNGDASAVAISALLNFPTGLTLVPNGGPGNTAANVLVSDTINNRVRSIAAVASIEPVAIVSFSPNPVVLPAQAIGQASGPTVVTLTNTGGAILNVSNVGFTGTDAAQFAQTNNCTAVAAGQSCTINVTITPTGAAGSRSAAISVTDDAAGSPHSVNITGTAGTPTAALNPTSLAFPSTAVGTTSAAQTITLTNNGDAPTLVTGAAISGTNAADFAVATNTCGIAGGILPTANCTISVTYKPSTGGAESATLTIADNVGTGSQTVALTSAASTLSLTVKVTDASPSQTVTAGATATYNLSVSGNQSVTAAITCTGAPTAATCSASPASVAVTAAAAGTFKVSVTTTARGEMVPFNQPSTKMQPPTFLQIAPMASIALLFMIAVMLGWMQNEAGRARTLRVALSLALILMPIAAATVLVGCGGGGSTPPPPPASGTPAGTYTLTVAATSGTTTATTALTLVVN